MLLRTLTGKYAGQIRDYEHAAALAALRAGVAERPDAPARQAAPATVPTMRPTGPNQDWDLIGWIGRSSGQPKYIAAGV